MLVLVVGGVVVGFEKGIVLAAKQSRPKALQGMHVAPCSVASAGRKLATLSGLCPREVNITVHERASEVMGTNASPIISQHLSSVDDDAPLQEGLSQRCGRIRKCTFRALALAALPQIRRCKWLCPQGLGVKWLERAWWCRGPLACMHKLPSSVGNEGSARGTLVTCRSMP